MPDLDESLRRLDQLDPPDLWADITTKEPGHGPAPSPRARFGAIAVAFIIAAVGIALAAKAFLGGREERKPTASPTPAPTAAPAAVTNGEIWARVGGGDGPSFVYSVQPDGSSQTLLFSDQNAEQRPEIGEQYAWSPDGSRVAFVGWSNPDQQAAYTAIFVMNADGSDVTQLTPDSEVDSGPAWSPDGARIAYSSDRTGPFSESAGCWASPLCPGDIHVMNADGSGDVQLTAEPADDSQPTWSPDGTKIAFVSRRDIPDPGDIFVMNADGSGLTQLSSGPGWDMGPRWLPDGSRIAFLSYQKGASDVYTMNPDGTDVRRLTDTGVPDSPFSFAWSPDGREVAFSHGSSIDVIEADGTGQRTIAEFHSYDAGDLAWRPS